MVDLISQAYKIDGDDVWGGPSWLEMDRFDIVAKVPANSKPEAHRAMLQTLLADRFKLMIRQDNKPMPAFALTAGKHPLLKKSEESAHTSCACKFPALPSDLAPASPTNP